MSESKFTFEFNFLDIRSDNHKLELLQLDVLTNFFQTRIITAFVLGFVWIFLVISFLKRCDSLYKFFKVVVQSRR